MTSRLDPGASSFRGWRVVRAGSFIWALQSFIWLQGFGNLAVAMREEFGWSKTLFSVAFSTRRFETALLGPVVGGAIGRYGRTVVMKVGAVISLVGISSIALVNSPTVLIITMLVGAAGATCTGILTLSSATVSWFERRRARALSYQSMGFAVGGFAGPLLVVSFNLIGWRATIVLAGSVFGIAAWVLADVIGMKRRDDEPVDGIAEGDVADTPQAEGVQAHQFTAREAMRTRAFWMIAMGHGAALLVVSSVLAHLTLYLTEDQGYGAGRAALVAGFVPAFQFVGTAAGGFLGDRYNKRKISGVAMLMHGGGLLILAYAQHWTMVAIFVVLHGLAWGMRGPQMGALRADYFGTKSYGSILGWSSLIIVVGSIGGPLLAGALADATGDYRLGFTILGLAAIAGTVFWALASPPSAPVQSPIS